MINKFNHVLYVLWIIILSSLPVLSAERSSFMTRCIWIENLGKRIEQKCKVTVTYDSISSSRYLIEWQDGLKTDISKASNKTIFTTPSGTVAQLSSGFLENQIFVPKKIHLSSLGSIEIIPIALTGDSSNSLILPDGILFDSLKKLVVEYQSRYDQTSIKNDYKYHLIDVNIISKIRDYQHNCSDRHHSGRLVCKENNIYKLKDSNLSVMGSFPVNYIVQTYSSPVSKDTAHHNASIISGIDFSKPYITQEDRELYVDSVLGETSIILNSCLFEINGQNKISKTTCIFSTP